MTSERKSLSLETGKSLSGFANENEKYRDAACVC